MFARSFSNSSDKADTDDLGRVGARLVQHDVRGVEDLAEEIELLAQDLEREAVRFVVLRDEVDHRDVALLAVPVAAADALLDALRVPRQVVVDDRLAELEVQPLRARFRADEHLRPRAKLVNQREPHGDLARRPGPRREIAPFLLDPARVRLLRAVVIVVPPKERDVLVAEADVEEQPPQVLLRGDGLGEHDRLAAAAAVATEIEDDSYRVLKRPRFRIVRKGLRARDEVLDTRQLAGDRLAIDRDGRVLGGFLDFVFILEVVEIIVRDPGAVAGIETAQPRGDVLQARGERWNRRGHAAVKADQEQPPLATGEGVQRRLQEVLGHVVVERPLVVAHRVLVEPAAALRERSVEELLRLTTERALEDHGRGAVAARAPDRGRASGRRRAEHFAEGVMSPSSVPVGSTYCTRPHSSASEFCIGVAVSSSTGAERRKPRTRCAISASSEVSS